MSDFTKNLYIIYTDESENFSYKSCKSYSMTSIIVPYDYYNEKLEPDWNELKKKYKIPEGVCLHFTDIKALLRPNYFERESKTRNQAMEKIFSKKSKVNYQLLKSFYKDILTFIEEHEFSIVVTYLNERPEENFTKKIRKEHLHSSWYVLFRNHLDDLTEYAIRKMYRLDEKVKIKRKFKAKIRYDGDYGLSNKNDIRDAYSNSVSIGTNRFNGKTVRDCIDELRFINKSDVGYSLKGKYNQNNRITSHGGNEIVDFIAAYAGKFVTAEMNKRYLKTIFSEEPYFKDLDIEKKIEEVYEKSMTIRIEDEILRPLESLEEKIFN